MKKAAMFWSGGKDSAFALYTMKRDHAEFEIVTLITTLNEAFKRISMHGVREELLDAQASEIGIPLHKMWVLDEPSNNAYEKVLRATYQRLKAQGVDFIIFGDIFLEDLKAYRDQLLDEFGLTGIYPLWKKNTGTIINEFLAAGFRTCTCCISTKYLDKSWAGKIIDERFVADLPTSVDPCGENGEFHTFCFEGPIYAHPIRIVTGENRYHPLTIAQSDSNSEEIGFWYSDLILAA